MSTRIVPRITRIALAAALATAALTPAVVHAQFRGLGQMIGSRVAGSHQSKGFPPGFSEARFQVTAERVDGIVRAITQYQAALTRYKAAEARHNAADQANAPQAERDRQRQMAAMAPALKCAGEVSGGIAKLSAGDPRRARVDALTARLTAMEEENERRTSTGQPVDSVAMIRRATALQDSLAIVVVGHRCPPLPKDMLAGGNSDAGGGSTGSTQPVPPDIGESMTRESHLDAMQQAVLCDKFVAYFGAQSRHIEPAGFTPAELDVLRAQGPRLHEALTQAPVCSGIS